MKHSGKVVISLVLLLCSIAATAQNPLNSHPESLAGDYYIDHAKYKCKVRISREDDGTFSARVFYVENPIDPDTGKKLTDIKNPNKALRNVPCDRIVLLYGIKYNERKQCWDGGKVYDPTCGIIANAMLEFVPDGRLKVKGSLMGISEFVHWFKIK